MTLLTVLVIREEFLNQKNFRIILSISSTDLELKVILKILFPLSTEMKQCNHLDKNSLVWKKKM